ncbi:MAG: hypothetical protein HYT71_03925 [Candidatus Aenigmarchaeota archaeon]|nr:hypothetical protein [Candidatus Aenigmarchaeota archaeon]
MRNDYNKLDDLPSDVIGDYINSVAILAFLEERNAPTFLIDGRRKMVEYRRERLLEEVSRKEIVLEPNLLYRYLLDKGIKRYREEQEKYKKTVHNVEYPEDPIEAVNIDDAIFDEERFRLMVEKGLTGQLDL